ncbi:hypothetical protein K439DRAFT_1303999, partial [Ramaria rubella]
PFRHHMLITGINQQPIALMSTTDGGAMMNAINWLVWKDIEHRLGKITPLRTRAKMANGMVIPLQGRWIGHISMGKVSAIGGFEILESGGAFKIFLGKPWLATAGLAQDFATDTLHVK